MRWPRCVLPLLLLRLPALTLLPGHIPTQEASRSAEPKFCISALISTSSVAAPMQSMSGIVWSSTNWGAQAWSPWIKACSKRAMHASNSSMCCMIPTVPEIGREAIIVIAGATQRIDSPGLQPNKRHLIYPRRPRLAHAGAPDRAPDARYVNARHRALGDTQRVYGGVRVGFKLALTTGGYCCGLKRDCAETPNSPDEIGA